MSTDTTKQKHCDYNNYKRARYFHGMLLTERDFQEEQLYHQEKRRLLNRMLHGWGVVCGLGVKATTPASSKIVITPGMALDCLGNEIVVCHDFEIDLKKLPDLCPGTGATTKEPCPEEGAQECKYFIGIKYTEAPTDPVPVYVPGGSCEEKTCEYSRIREGYCVNLFKSPPCHAVPPQDGLYEKIVDCLNLHAAEPAMEPAKKFKCAQQALKDFQATFCQQPYPCPVCCCDGEPYVILGSLDLETTDCMVKTISQEMININDKRRYVMTPMFWQYYLGSFVPGISDFLDNPFNQICEPLVDPSAQMVNFVLKVVAIFYGMTSAGKKSEEQTKKDLDKQNLVYHQTVALTPSNALSLASRAIAVEKIDPGTPVDLVTDSSGRVLFHVPAEVAPEKMDVAALRKETNEKIAAMDAAYKRQLDNLNTIIKELKGTKPK